MNIAMTGATGYIGKHLSSYLTEKGGHRVIPLGRSMFREGMSGLLIQTLAHCDVVINLAGAPINKRWTPEYKQELFNSRIVVTHRIVRALNAGKTIPGLGNGVSQDILYHTHIHPKKKISGLTDKERENLFYQIKETMNDIYHLGGRSTESDLFGANGKYVACLSKDTAGMACPRCGETIVKENYLGGSIYYCRGCQPLPTA